MTDWIDETALLAGVARAGEQVSADQLKRWRRAGLVPRPRVEHVAGLRGSRALYPRWAVKQLVAVVRLHHSQHRIGSLGVALWWEGLWVEPSALRQALSAPLEKLSARARAAGAGQKDPEEVADVILAEETSKGSPSAVFSLFRKRMRDRGDVMSLLWALLVVGLGGSAPWSTEDRSAPDSTPTALELLTVGSGADRAMSDDPLGHGSWVPPGFDVRELLERLCAIDALNVDDVARPIREATDTELARARDDALMFSGQLATIGRGLEGLLGDDVAGFASLTILDAPDVFSRAALIRNMLLLRQLVGDAAFAAVAQLVDAEYERYAAIEKLRMAVPQHQAVLRHELDRRLAELSPADADRVREDVARYLREHPEVAEALEARA